MGTHRIATRWNQLIDARIACCSTVCGTTGLALHGIGESIGATRDDGHRRPASDHHAATAATAIPMRGIAIHPCVATASTADIDRRRTTPCRGHHHHTPASPTAAGIAKSIHKRKPQSSRAENSCVLLPATCFDSVGSRIVPKATPSTPVGNSIKRSA